MSWAEAGDPASAYARTLLTRHAISAAVPETGKARSTAADWADSGAMALTGTSSGPPRLVEGAPATAVRGALLALESLARIAGLDPTGLPDARVLSERAAYMGLRRNGRTSAGGASRLLDAADGSLAMTLSREDDFAALPALTGGDVPATDPWPAVVDWVARTSAAEVVARAELLGLAAGVVDSSVPAAVTTTPAIEPVTPAALPRAPLVVDLSALWAGPLCGHLLGRLGARVVTVESTSRPDPTRTVAPGFHGLLRGRTELVTVDLATPAGLARLTELVTSADVVIESSRPRALLQLGIYPAEIVAASKACSWISITAYGRAHNRVGYGDDVAASAGLLGTATGFDAPVFAADAIGDPLTGVHAAVAALAGVLTGASTVVDLAMYDVVRATRTPLRDATVVERSGVWYVDDGRALTAVRNPAVRSGT
ncbi:MAG TPA: CoA transferase [Mycobacteriales bacterium]|nr:CoA transferase [Mycobacteriales bacterium]